MKKLIFVTVLGSLFAAAVASAQAPGTGRVTPEYPKSGSPGIGVTPGAGVPGSENKNIRLPPTSPTGRMKSQPLSDHPASSGSGTGETGASRPNNSATPQDPPKD
ncbi:MAG: hypothetical protein JSS54_10100 [Proteobacteria bacterium]|nr:hypothetical protein [Pseudomonadota bacterium]